MRNGFTIHSQYSSTTTAYSFRNSRDAPAIFRNTFVSTYSFSSTFPDIYSQLGPRLETSNFQPLKEPPSTPIKRSCHTSRDERIAIRTALLFNIPYKDIYRKLGVTERQIWYTKNHRITPQKNRAGRHPLLCAPEKRELETWILESPSHRRVAFHNIPRCVPLLRKTI